MKNGLKYHGAVVPMVTPFTPQGALDETAVDQLVDFQIAGGVAGIFVMGTTGEGASIPGKYRRLFVERTVARVNGRAKIFAGLGDAHPQEIEAGNRYLRAGVDALVSRPPLNLPPNQLLPWYKNLLDGLEGPLLIYNIPMTTNVSIPLDVVEKLMGHPRLAGIKDSENNPARHEELLKRFGGKKDFSVFIGVGALMEKGLKMGADGIVPSVGNLIPDICQQLCEAAQKSAWTQAEALVARMNSVAALYQKGRTLNESLSALKAAMHCLGLCSVDMLPPLKPLPPGEVEKIRSQMAELHLLNGKS